MELNHIASRIRWTRYFCICSILLAFLLRFQGLVLFIAVGNDHSPVYMRWSVTIFVNRMQKISSHQESRASIFLLSWINKKIYSVLYICFETKYSKTAIFTLQSPGYEENVSLLFKLWPGFWDSVLYEVSDQIVSIIRLYCNSLWVICLCW